MQTKKQQRWLLIGKVLVVLALAGLFYWLNTRTVLLWDDLDYSFIATGAGSYGDRLESVGDVIQSQITFRQTWGGRNVVHFIAQFFLMLGDKRIFDVCNTLVYMLLIWAIWANSGFKKGRGFAAVPLIFYMLWYLPRHFNQSALWLVGSCNYLWGITLVMTALVPFSRRWFAPDAKDVKLLDHWWAAVVYCIFCFFAGWTNENTGFALPMMMVLFIIANRIAGSKNARWMPFAAASALAGWIVLFAAPGNWNRMGMAGEAENPGAESGFVSTLIHRFISMTTILVKRYMPVAILALAACLVYYWMHQKGWDRRSSWYAYLPVAVFTLGSLGSVYAMLATPSFSARAWFGITALIVLTATAALALIAPDKRIYTLLLCAALLWAPKYMVDYKNALDDVNNNNAYWTWCQQQIEEAKAAGQDEIVLPVHRPVTAYSHAGIFTEDPNEWPCTTMADWYGIGKISFSKDLPDPFYEEYDLT